MEDDVGGVEIGVKDDVEWKVMGEWGSVEERGAIITTVINLCRQRMNLQASLFHRTERTGTDRLTISRNGTDGTVYHRAMQHNELAKYQVSNAVYCV